MVHDINLCGRSGRRFQFSRMPSESELGKQPAVVVFAAREGRGWRVIKVAAQSGVDGDVGIFWRWREARRFGATDVFLHPVKDAGERRALALRLEAELEPACPQAAIPSNGGGADPAVIRLLRGMSIIRGRQPRVPVRARSAGEWSSIC
jgi:hypothetical protein